LPNLDKHFDVSQFATTRQKSGVPQLCAKFLAIYMDVFYHGIFTRQRRKTNKKQHTATREKHPDTVAA